jgi:hypothetical protein
MIPRSLIDLIYEAAGNAGFLQPCRWEESTAIVGLQSVDRDVLNHLTLSSDTSMTYPSSCFLGLKTGHRVELGDAEYQVREVVMIADGSEMRATLTKL